MKKIFCLWLAFIYSIATFPSNSALTTRAEDFMIILFGSDQKISLANYVKLTPAQYKKITGKKLDLKEKFSLKILQRHLRKSIKKDGTVDIEKFIKLAEDAQSFNIGWFFLGFFLGLIGFIIALVINDEKKSARVKWTGIGLLGFIALGLLIQAIVGPLN